MPLIPQLCFESLCKPHPVLTVSEQLCVCVCVCVFADYMHASGFHIFLLRMGKYTLIALNNLLNESNEKCQRILTPIQSFFCPST